jgi:co-chaperonin GroES (HSP10)
MNHPQALGQYIFCIKDAPKECMEGGILIPESLERTPRFGPSVLATVVSVGARCTVLKAGDRICLKDVAGDDIIFNDTTYIRVREKDCNGLVTEE